jgi:glycerophosphoryl diester phosphodiesterase
MEKCYSYNNMSVIIGHRGARGLAPENTLVSLQEAMVHDVHEIEIDIRVTKDGVCVLNHDPYLHEASGRKLRWAKIADMTYAQLLEYRPDLPTLEQAIRLVKRRVPLVLEIKSGVPTTHVIAVIKQFLAQGWAPTDFLLASFAQRSLRELHHALPTIPIVINERLSGLRATWRARQVGAKRIAINHHNIWWGFVSAMSRAGWQLTTFSLNDPKKAARWTQRGLHGVITDFPNRFTHGSKHKH